MGFGMAVTVTAMGTDTIDSNYFTAQAQGLFYNDKTKGGLATVATNPIRLTGATGNTLTDPCPAVAGAAGDYPECATARATADGNGFDCSTVSFTGATAGDKFAAAPDAATCRRGQKGLQESRAKAQKHKELLSTYPSRRNFHI